MFSHRTQVRVRYAETDQMGYVYYGNYSTYYEVARVESLRSLGFAYKELENQGIMMPVLENHSTFLHPAKYDELLTIEVAIKKPPTVRIGFYYDVYDEVERLIHQGETQLAFVNMTTGKPCRPPDVMMQLLNPYFS